MPYILSAAPLLVLSSNLLISLNLSNRILVLGVMCLVNLSGCLNDGTLVPYGYKALTLLRGIHRCSECRIRDYHCIEVKHGLLVCEACRTTVLELLELMDQNSRMLIVAHGKREERLKEEDKDREQEERERAHEERKKAQDLAAKKQALEEGEEVEGQDNAAEGAESELEDGELEEGEAEKREIAEAEAQEKKEMEEAKAQEKKEKEEEAERQRVGGLSYDGNDER